MSKLLIIGYVWPEPVSSAAGSRMMQLIRFFLEGGYSICFATTAQKTPYMEDLSALGVRTAAIELNNESFDIFVREFQPEVVLFDRFMMEEQFGWRVSENCPDALRILDTEDLHFLRKARQTALRQQSELTPALLQTHLAMREIASIYRCDLSLIISRLELQLLREEFFIPEKLLRYLPLTEKDSVPDPKELSRYDQRKNFISIGNFLHEPNWDAVLYLKNEIWPLIRRSLPQVEIAVYGAYPSQKVFQLNNPKEGFLVKGRADSAMEVLQHSRVLLAPLRFGAGIKGKFIDAMRTGTPSVTTSTGAEGMSDGKTWAGNLAQGSDAFAEAAVTLYTDKDLWQTSQNIGIEILKEHFLESTYKSVFLSMIEKLRGDLKVHRQANFIGTMLSHHQLNSTKYFSKYLEMKNQLEAALQEKTPAENNGR